MLYAPGRLLSPVAGGGGAAGLDYNFLGYSADTLPSAITFSRASLAWQYDSSGTLTTVPHNLATNSQDFDASAWTKTNGTATGSVVAAPDGTTTGDLITGTASTVYATQNITIASGAKVVVSVYAKQGGGGANTFMRLRVQSGAEVASQWFNLATGGIGTTTSTANIVISSPTATDAGGGWYRVSAVFTTTGFTTLGVGAGPATANSNGGVSGDTVYLWGYQAEVHTIARPYLITSVRNLIGFSEQLDNAAWLSEGASGVTVTANAATSPFGTAAADKLVEGNNSNSHSLYQNIGNWDPATTFTASAYLKAAERSNAILDVRPTSGASGFQGRFDLSAGTASSSTFGGVGATAAATITPMGNSWYRCAVTGITNATPGAAVATRLLIRATNAAWSTTYAGDGTSGLYAFGAQVSSSGSLDTYSPNVGAAPSSAAYHGPALDYQVPASATNLLTYSEQFDNAIWTKTRTTVSANTTATTDPLGGTAADKVVEQTDTATNRHVQQSLSVISGITYGISVYAKAAERTAINLRFGSGFAAGNVTYDLSAGSLTTSGSVAGSSITSIGNGWYRCWASFTATSSTTAGAQIFLSSGGVSYDGVAGNGVYLFGAQVEQASSIGAYSATTSASTTLNTTSALGLRIEEARTNLVPGTMTGGTYWTGLNATVASGTTAPDGTTNAVTVTENASGTTAYGVNLNNASAGTITASTATTASIFAKAGTGSWLRFLLADNVTPTVGAAAWFNLATGAVGTVGSFAGSPTSISATIQSVGNGGWYRCTLTGTLSTATTGVILLRMVSADSATTDPGSKTMSFYAPQIEVGAFASSPIITTTAAVTRAQDIVTIAPLGNWHNESEGTFLTEYQSPNQTSLASTGVVFGVTDGTANNVVYLTAGATFDGGNINLGGVSQMGVSNTSPPLTAKKTAIAYKLNDSAWVRNGGTVSSDTSCTMPTGMTSASLGKAPWSPSSNPLNGYIRRLRIYRTRLPNAVLQVLTS